MRYLVSSVFKTFIGMSCLVGFGFTSATRNSSPQQERLAADDSAFAASPCAHAFSQQVVCLDANKHAIEIMRADHLEAVTVIQDVRTGAVITFAASQPSKLDVNTHVLPLSLSKLLLAASWWDNQQPDSTFDSTDGRSRVSVHEMLVGGSDTAGRQMAVALRHSIGTKLVLQDFARYGFSLRTASPEDPAIWADLNPTWKKRLIARPAYVQLSDETADTEWADTLSIGEANMSVTAVHMSRFLQAVGNNGVMLPPVAREKARPKSLPPPTNSSRIMKESTAQRLQAAMREVVQRGTAKSIATVLEKTKWQIGGKTGTGPGVIGPQSDGWFAGLIFDPKGNARLTVATFVRHGGRGGGNAARISAELARFIINGRAAQ